MTEDSITRRLSNALSTTLRRFVRQINDDLGTGTEVPAIPNIRAIDPNTEILMARDGSGWAYRKGDEIGIRERYERECV